MINFTNTRLKVSYSGTTLKPSVSFRNPFKEVVLNKKKKVVIERHTQQPGLLFDGDQIDQFGHTFIQPDMNFPVDPGTLNRDLMGGASPFEIFRPGLGDYF